MSLSAITIHPLSARVADLWSIGVKKMKTLKFRWLEKIAVGYAILMLGLLLAASVGRMIVCGIAFEILMKPVGMLLSIGNWCSFLPDGLQYFIAYLTALTNGALFYALLKTVFRKPNSQKAERPNQHLRATGQGKSEGSSGVKP